MACRAGVLERGSWSSVAGGGGSRLGEEGECERRYPSWELGWEPEGDRTAGEEEARSGRCGLSFTGQSPAPGPRWARGGALLPPEKGGSKGWGLMSVCTGFFCFVACIFFLYFFQLSIIIVILLFRATPVSCGGSQARGRIGTTDAGLHHSQRNARPILQPEQRQI